jgi:PGF-CTERM protein
MSVDAKDTAIFLLLEARTPISTPAPDPTPTSPGFGALFALTGLGVAALFGRRQN